VQVDGGDKAQLPYPTGANVSDITYVDAELLREYYLVTDYDNKDVALAFRDATITPEGLTTTNIAFDGSNLIVTLTVSDATEILAWYVNGNDDMTEFTEKLDATVTKNGVEFTITFDVNNCTAEGAWYKLFVQIDDEAPARVPYPTTVDVATITYVDATANREYYLTTEWDTETVSLVFRPATSD
jgi:hypothetical protein